jgi:hypothetical protein
MIENERMRGTGAFGARGPPRLMFRPGGAGRQVAQQRVEAAAGAGGVGQFEALAELVHGEPTLAHRLVEPADDGVALGVRRSHVRTGTVLFAHRCEGSARA